MKRRAGPPKYIHPRSFKKRLHVSTQVLLPNIIYNTGEPRRGDRPYRECRFVPLSPEVVPAQETYTEDDVAEQTEQPTLFQVSLVSAGCAEQSNTYQGDVVNVRVALEGKVPL